MKGLALGVLTGLVGLLWSPMAQADDLSLHCRQVQGGCLQISKAKRTVTYYQQGKSQKSWPIAIGRPGLDTPAGNFWIYEKGTMVDWQSPLGEVIPYNSPRNPMAGIWMGYVIADGVPLGLHGTNTPNLIGQAVSAGCNRMHTHHAKELYKFVVVGDPVYVR